MELWKKYIKEREGADIIYNDYGFVTYRNLNDSEIMIIDVFVDKEYRKTGAVQKLWEELIKKTTPKITYGSTDIKALNWESSHNFMINFGFIPYQREEDVIFYYREIK